MEKPQNNGYYLHDIQNIVMVSNRIKFIVKISKEDGKL
jgi:hypothetical protein